MPKRGRPRKRGGITQDIPPDADLLEHVRVSRGVKAAWERSHINGQPPCPLRTWQDRVRRARERWEQSAQPLPEEIPVKIPPPPPPPPKISLQGPPDDKGAARAEMLAVMHSAALDPETPPKDRAMVAEKLIKTAHLDERSSEEGGNYGLEEGRRLRAVRGMLAARLGDWLRQARERDHELDAMLKPESRDVPALAAYLAERYEEEIHQAVGL